MTYRSLTWPDLFVGQSFSSASRSVTETDVIAFAGLTGDYSEIHVSRQYAATTAFGEPIAHGLLGLSYAHGLMFGGGLLAGTAIAFLGLEEWRFEKPILLGDTIHVDFTVADLRVRNSNAAQGIVTFDVNVVNQGGVRVQAGRKAILLHTGKSTLPNET